MTDLLRRGRPVNLLMILLIQALVYYTVLHPFLHAQGLAGTLAEPEFWMLAGSVLLIAAGGYLVNDLFDTQEDALNKPGRPLDRPRAMTAYLVLTAAGIATGAYLSLVREIPAVLNLHLVSALLLYLYSRWLRRFKIVGNVVVAGLVALSLLIVLWSDRLARQDPLIRAVIYGYAYFAFMISWAREIVKDMEDLEGDRLFGKKTLPVVAGMKASRIVAGLLVGMVVFSLAYIQYRQRQWEDLPSLLYVVVLIQVPLIVMATGLFRARSRGAFRRLSMLAKGIMLTGMLSMLAFYLLY